ncbi:MAG TPA: class I SAM-dependent methyltransferase [Iamia sp.]|nr:class I SAM-dependent methyltransferase [Iamia sp.]
MTWDRLRSSYDAAAEAYETAFLDELDGKPADRERLATFAAVVGDPVLDLGCGPGQIGAAVAAAGRRVHGVDLSPAMAGRAATRLAGAVGGDLRALPIRSGAAAAVVAAYSLIHLRREEQGRAWAEIARVLRPGGRALVTAHEGTGTVAVDDFLGTGAPFVATLLGLDEMTAAAGSAGLEVVAATRRDPYPQEHPTVRLTVEVVSPPR